jgi:hypothetical protein
VIVPAPGELWEAPEEQRMNKDIAEHAIVLSIEDVVVYLDDDDVGAMLTQITYYDTGFDKIHIASVKEFNNIFTRVTH